MTTTPATRTGTRKQLGLAYGDRVTVQTHLGAVTGTVATDNNGWTLTDRDVEGHLPGFGHATRVTVVAAEPTSGHLLREVIEDMCGEDAVTNPVFQWSDTEPCDGCGDVDSTAVVSFDGEVFQRLCFDCVVQQ